MKRSPITPGSTHVSGRPRVSSLRSRGHGPCQREATDSRGLLEPKQTWAISLPYRSLEFMFLRDFGGTSFHCWGVGTVF